ncbi:MAG: hypothetical protein GC185_01790 [Alphaproteobacteria bacterium]|nr:hypothetical protein [Alphaproteobacteria bacterium]
MPAFLGDLLVKLLDFLKPLAFWLYIKRSTNIEAEKDVLDDANKKKKAQLDIANGPADQPSDVLDSMRSGDL